MWIERFVPALMGSWGWVAVVLSLGSGMIAVFVALLGAGFFFYAGWEKGPILLEGMRQGISRLP